MEKTWEEELKECFLREGEGRGARSALRTLRQQHFRSCRHLTAAVLTIRNLDELKL